MKHDKSFLPWVTQLCFSIIRSPSIHCPCDQVFAGTTDDAIADKGPAEKQAPQEVASGDVSQQRKEDSNSQAMHVAEEPREPTDYVKNRPRR